MSFFDEHKDEIFKKYDTATLLKDIQNYQLGAGKLNKVLNHFFEELIYEAKAPRGNKTPMEALKNDDDIKFIIEYTQSKPNFYTGNQITNIKSFFRNAGRLAQKVANFCPKTAREIYFRYHDINGEKINILDTSCGFGSRMSAVLLSGHNYCGFDPNKKLYDKLVEYYLFLKNNNIITKEQRCGLYCQGSEIYRPELKCLFDVSFTSPPYFDFEVYSQDLGQSIMKFPSYEDWLNGFVRPTILNTYEYLKHGGYAMINIKNLTHGKKYPLFDDWFKVFESIQGFEFVEVFEMQHQSKKNYTMNSNYSKEQYHGFKEPIMVFKKK